MKTAVVSCGVRKMNLPATANGAYLNISVAMAWTTVATGVTRLPARTAPPLAPSPVACLTHVSPERSYVTGELTAKTDEMSLRSCVVGLVHSHRLLSPVRRLSFSVEMGSASARPGDVTTHQTALMVVTRTTVIRMSVRSIMEAALIGVWTSQWVSSVTAPTT